MHTALACLSTSAHWYSAPTRSGGDDLALLHQPKAIPLLAGGRELFLEATQLFRFRWDEELQEQRVTTRAYRYTIATDPVMQNECMAWHWQPETSPFPHLHIQRVAHPELGDLGRLHLPTARISFESLARFLIKDLDVPCRGEDGWEDALRQNEEDFVRYRQWHHEYRDDDEGGAAS